MRRLLRILLNAVTILSLLLCLASVGMWVQSYRRAHLIRWVASATPGARHIFVAILNGDGGAAVFVGTYAATSEDGPAPEGWTWRSYGQAPMRYAGGSPANRWGFGYDSFRDSASSGRGVVFPTWVATALFAALPLACGVHVIRRRRRVRQGHCKKCGYDLRATPDRCPECGHFPATR